MIECKVLRSFPFSCDGVTVEHANAGATVLLPAQLVQGLCKAAYVVVAPAQAALNAVQTPDPVVTTAQGVAKPWEPGFAPEKKVIEAAPENKTAIKIKDDYRTVETGAGWYTVFKGDLPAKGVRKLRAADVRAFNAMTPEERIRFIKGETATK
jgi:hypothetical protein